LLEPPLGDTVFEGPSAVIRGRNHEEDHSMSNTNKEKAEETKSVLDVLDKTADFVTRMHALGGIGYVLFGFSFVCIIAVIFVFRESLQSLPSLLIPLAIGAAVVAVLFVVADKFLAFHAANIKLQMVSRITEKLVEATIREKDRITTGDVERNVRSILTVWRDDKEPTKPPGA
jgi:hypothetical protein